MLIDSLERVTSTFYHPTRTATNPTIVPGFTAIVHTMDPVAERRRWSAVQQPRPRATA